MADSKQTPATQDRGLRLLATLTNSVFILTVLACMAAAHWLSDLLNPFMVAVFALILIDSLALQVGKLLPKLADWAHVGIAFAIISLVLLGAGALVVHGAPRFATHMLDAVNKAQVVGYQISSGLNLPHAARFEGLDLKPYVSGMLAGLRQLASDLILVLLYLGFLLASRRTFHQKVARLFPSPKSQEHAERVFQRVRVGTESYIGLQAFKGVLLAVIFLVVMKLFGLPNAIFMAFLVFLASFIPILGPAAAVAVPVVLALAQFGFGWRAIAMFVCLEGAVIGIDSVLLPRLQGERLNVDPVVVLVSLAFWTTMFGIVGAVFSTMLTVVVIAIASETPRLRWLAIVLSKRGEAVSEGV